MGKPHGVRGAVRARLYNPQSEMLEPGSAVTLALPAGGERRLQLLEVGHGADHLVLGLAGVNDRDAAAALSGARILVDRAALPSPDVDEESYYYHDLIGCVVRDESGLTMGRVTALFEAGASDVLVVRAGDEERYLPLVPDWVEAVDLELREIRLACSADDWESWEV